MVNVLLSYPRSGNTWVRYVLEYTSLQPTHTGLIKDINNSDLKKNAVGDKYINGLDCKKQAICVKRHYTDKKWDHWDSNDSFILLVRDYRECILKHVKPVDRIEERFKKEAEWYINLLKFYDKYSGSKLLIYYEDVMHYPEREFEKIIKFWNINNTRFNSFLKKYDEHKIKILKHYHGDKAFRYSSLGKKLKMHQSMAPKKMVLQIENFIILHKGIYNKYLIRYS